MSKDEWDSGYGNSWNKICQESGEEGTFYLLLVKPLRTCMNVHFIKYICYQYTKVAHGYFFMKHPSTMNYTWVGEFSTCWSNFLLFQITSPFPIEEIPNAVLYVVIHYFLLWIAFVYISISLEILSVKECMPLLNCPVRWRMWFCLVIVWNILYMYV